MASSNTISATECSVFSCFLALAQRKLNRTEKQALALLASSNEKKSSTQTAKTLAAALQCAESTAWSTLRSLRSLRLITQDDKQFLTLSKSARLLAKEIQQ